MGREDVTDSVVVGSVARTTLDEARLFFFCWSCTSSRETLLAKNLD